MTVITNKLRVANKLQYATAGRSPMTNNSKEPKPLSVRDTKYEKADRSKAALFINSFIPDARACAAEQVLNRIVATNCAANRIAAAIAVEAANDRSTEEIRQQREIRARALAAHLMGRERREERRLETLSATASKAAAVAAAAAKEEQDSLGRLAKVRAQLKAAKQDAAGEGTANSQVGSEGEADDSSSSCNTAPVESCDDSNSLFLISSELFSEAGSTVTGSSCAAPAGEYIRSLQQQISQLRRATTSALAESLQREQQLQSELAAQQSELAAQQSETANSQSARATADAELAKRDASLRTAKAEAKQLWDKATAAGQQVSELKEQLATEQEKMRRFDGAYMQQCRELRKKVGELTAAAAASAALTSAASAAAPPPSSASQGPAASVVAAPAAVAATPALTPAESMTSAAASTVSPALPATAAALPAMAAAPAAAPLPAAGEKEADEADAEDSQLQLALSEFSREMGVLRERLRQERQQELQQERQQQRQQHQQRQQQQQLKQQYQQEQVRLVQQEQKRQQELQDREREWQEQRDRCKQGQPLQLQIPDNSAW